MKTLPFVLALTAVAAVTSVTAQTGHAGMAGMTPSQAPAAPTPRQLAAMAQKAARLGLPPGTLQAGPCVPGMGEHWVKPEDWPFGPIYGVVQNRVVFVEVMIDQKAFAAGRSWDEQLRPLAGKRIDHVDIDFNPHGHAGYEVPHYDVHAYFVPHAEHLGYCPPPVGQRPRPGGS